MLTGPADSGGRWEGEKAHVRVLGVQGLRESLAWSGVDSGGRCAGEKGTL